MPCLFNNFVELIFRFYNNLQRELIEIEFHEFARGKTEISSVDFTRLVLRYSLLHQRDHLVYVKRIYERSQPEDEVCAYF